VGKGVLVLFYNYRVQVSVVVESCSWIFGQKKPPIFLLNKPVHKSGAQKEVTAPKGTPFSKRPQHFLEKK
jgi:hypothetical protein